MARTTLNPPSEVAWKTDADRGVTTIRRGFQVITPLFGGGVHIPKENAHLKEHDRVTPVRTASIRGQLRFWWRAAWGCQFDRTQMHAQEALIWGRAAVDVRMGDKKVTIGPGAVAIRLEQSARAAGSEQAGRGPGDPRSYGTFPLQPAREAPIKEAGKLTRLQGESLLVLTCTGLDDPQMKGVERALTAWLAFGGLGGRTRRGFGAVHPAGSLNPAAVLDEIQQGLVNRAGVPSLADAKVVVRNANKSNALDAMDAGLERLKTFRQGARNSGSARPGRSHWPEPDAIRRITKRASDGHKHPETRTDAFPRAAFGLPIIFHFKDDRVGDPKDTTLKPRATERFASPLIIRPFRDTQGKYQTFALRLRGPGPGQVELGSSPADNVRTTLTPAELTTDLTKLNRTLDNQTDILAAFLAFFTR